MDKLHKEHEFVQKVWKFIKSCEEKQPHDDAFWDWAYSQAEQLSHAYEHLTYANDWLLSYLKSLDEIGGAK